MKGLIEVPTVFVEEILRRQKEKRERRLAELGTPAAEDDVGVSLLAAKRLERTVAQEAERARELSAAVRRRADRVIQRLRAGPSKKPPKTPRKDRDLDLKIFRRIRASLRRGDVVRLTSKPGPAVTDMRTRKRRIRTSRWKAEEEIDGGGSVDEICAAESTFMVPHWDHTGDRLKLLAWAMSIKGMGGQAMSLHIPDATWSKALKSARGPAAYLRDRMVKRLKKAFASTGFPPPEFFFLVEASSTVRPHLHGAIVVPPGMRTSVEAALIESVGVWRTGTRQLDLREITDAAGWACYVAKFTFTTMLTLEDRRIAAATNGLRSTARAWYLDRREQGDPLS